MLSLSPFHHNWHSLAGRPDPASRPGSRTTKAQARRVALAPASAPPPPPPPPPPSAPRFRLLGAGRRGERERPSPLSLPALGGRDCTSNLQHTPQRSWFPGALPPSQPSQPQCTEPFSSGGCPPPRLRFSRFQTGVCPRTPSHLPPSFPAQGITRKSPQGPRPSFLP